MGADPNSGRCRYKHPLTTHTSRGLWDAIPIQGGRRHRNHRRHRPLYQLRAGSDAGRRKHIRGFNGKTITVGGLADTSQFSGAQIGAEAYFKAVDATNYLKGVKIKFDTLANDAE